MKAYWIILTTFFFSCEESINKLEYDFVVDSLRTEIKKLNRDVLVKNDTIASLVKRIDGLEDKLSDLVSRQPVDFESRFPILFSSKTLYDTLVTSISGRNWESSIYKIRIIDVSGKKLYGFQRDFSNMVSGFNPREHKFLLEVAEEFLNKETQQFASELPPKFINTESETLEINDDEYSSLRARNVPIFRHQTYFEGWRILYYDTKIQLYEVIIEGGL